jgi:enediyne biosynthesis protein E3
VNTHVHPSSSADASPPGTSILGGWRARVFGIDPDAVTAETRGFAVQRASVAAHLNRVGETFRWGYDAGLRARDIDALIETLRCIEPVWRGFAYEGAAMACMLRDLLAPWTTSRWNALATVGDDHAYMVLVGAGWAVARLRWRPAASLARFDPLLGWLVIDGCGFGHGYFKQHPWPAPLLYPPRMRGYAARVADQGLGRSLWFVEQADPDRLLNMIGKAAHDRRADLWSGVGLAAAYAGCGGDEPYTAIARAAGRYLPALAQGVGFATEARSRAGHVPPHTHEACRVICRMKAEEVSRIVRELTIDLPTTSDVPAYEYWRVGIQKALAHGA